MTEIGGFLAGGFAARQKPLYHAHRSRFRSACICQTAFCWGIVGANFSAGMKRTMRILVGSCNPTKIAAVQDVFSQRFGQVEAIGLEVASGVSAQPMGMEETFLGAENRARALLDLNVRQQLNAQFCVGIEGGAAPLHGRWFAFGVICIADVQGRLGYGVTSHFELPNDVAHRLAAGAELGDVIDELTGQYHTRLEGGAIGYLSHGQLDRRRLAAQGVFMALLPFLNESLFFPKGG